MIVIFVHGWSVRSTDTYGELPARISQAAPDVSVEHVFVSQYISYEDEVTLDDIARTFDAELRLRVPAGERFACITHSTGGPVVRAWLDLFYGPDRLAECPMSHLVMLAPANHGSALAQLGKSRLSRMKFLLEGVEPGQHVLDWLELGSAGQWELNSRALAYRYVEGGMFPFVLTGQSIDRSLYDFLNSYTAEPGSDGVVRAAAANLNFSTLALDQSPAGELIVNRSAQSPQMAFGILPGVSHSGTTMGIMAGVPAAGPHPTVEWVLRCLSVRDAAGYRQVSDGLAQLTAATQEQERVQTVEKLAGAATYVTDRYSMFTFRLRDDRGRPLEDYDLLLTAGPEYDPGELPVGFFVDRQRNSLDKGRLTYYVNYDRMVEGLRQPALQHKIGFRVVARPDDGPARYTVAELRSDDDHVARLLRPNETTMVEITLRRTVESSVYRLMDRA